MANTTTRLCGSNLLGDTNTPLGPCIHASVVIGSLVDLGQDLHVGYVRTHTICYTWNVRLLTACGLQQA